jgi:cell division protein FtsI/penicillin-binding protein 2
MSSLRNRAAIAAAVILALSASAIAFASTAEKEKTGPGEKAKPAERKASEPATRPCCPCRDEEGASAKIEAAKPSVPGNAPPEPSDPAPSDLSVAELMKEFDPLNYRVLDERLVADLKGGYRAVLSLDRRLQEHVEKIFEKYQVPFGAVAAVEPATGRVLAYVSHSSADPDAGDLVRDPTPPSASVFKVVTAAALVDAGIQPDRRTCYGGGFRRLTTADLVDDPKRDRYCVSLETAMGSSVNAVFAKLADRHLSRATLARYASAFGFGHSLPFDARTLPSRLEVPADRIEFARTAAGFWHMHMSPLHGALIASTVANDGIMQRPSMVDEVVDATGRVLDRHEPRAFRSVIGAGTARVVGRLMRRTVTHGTARRAFYDPRNRPFLPGVSIAGKTGSLTQQKPYRAYSWWVGFAPVEKPKIAVAALVVNTPRWRIKASYAARETLRNYLMR